MEEEEEEEEVAVRKEEEEKNKKGEIRSLTQGPAVSRWDSQMWLGSRPPP